MSQDEGINLAGIRRILDLERSVESLEAERDALRQRLAEVESRRDRARRLTERERSRRCGAVNAPGAHPPPGAEEAPRSPRHPWRPGHDAYRGTRRVRAVIEAGPSGVRVIEGTGLLIDDGPASPARPTRRPALATCRRSSLVGRCVWLQGPPTATGENATRAPRRRPLAASRALGRGSGGMIGGEIALKIAPGILGELAAPMRTAIASGTNGKSTTTRMLRAALATRGRVASNTNGDNMTSSASSQRLGERARRRLRRPRSR